jgi:hypothetical protein
MNSVVVAAAAVAVVFFRGGAPILVLFFFLLLLLLLWFPPLRLLLSFRPAIFVFSMELISDSSLSTRKTRRVHLSWKDGRTVRRIRHRRSHRGDGQRRTGHQPSLQRGRSTHADRVDLHKQSYGQDGTYLKM